MEPRIQYARTSDGVNIAFWALGQGPALVHLSWGPVSHSELEWQTPGFRDWYQRLSEKRRVVRYDFRGSGLSERSVSEFTVEALTLDIQAVVDELRLEKFALFGGLHVGPVAINYAVRHPDRVSHLILWCSWARASDFYQSPQAQTLVLLRDQDWEIYTETIGHAFMGWPGGDRARPIARLIRESATQATFQAIASSASRFDATPLLPQMKVPTLVLHPREFRFVDVGLAKALASGIPNARLAIVDGSAFVPHSEGTDAALEAIEEFLSEGAASTAPDGSLPTGTAIILFADIVDSTALTERLGDAAFRAKARDLDATLRTLIRDHAGTPIEGKLLGDGVLAVFTSARQAIEAALACATAGDNAGLPLHLGLHAGDVLRESDPDGRANVYGGAVNIASRISSVSAPGEVLVSETVRSLARTSAGVRFEDRGEQALKGVGEPVRVWAVRQG